MGTLSVFYRPAQPTASRDVTVPGTVAHGAWVNGLDDRHAREREAVQAVPARALGATTSPCATTRTSSSRRPRSTVNRDVTFGQQHDTVVVNLGPLLPERRPGTTGHRAGRELDRPRRRLLDLERLHAAADHPDERGPERRRRITAFVRVGDASGLSRVAVLYHDTGVGTWNVVQLDHAGGDLWTKTFTIGSSNPIQLDSEAQDVNGNVGYSFNKAVNFRRCPTPPGRARRS